MATRLDPRRIFQQPEVVAGTIAAADIFGVLSRSFELPHDWVALVMGPEGDQRFFAGGANVPAENTHEVFLARSTPIDLKFREAELVSADGYRCSYEVELRVQIIAEASELSSFRRAVLGRQRLAAPSTLERHLQPIVHKSLVDFAGQRDAAALLDRSDEAALHEALRDALAGPCFTSGLALAENLLARFECPAFRQVRATEELASRSQREHDAKRQVQMAVEAAQSARLDHLQGLLARLQKNAESTPNVKLAELLHSFTERERGELYQALFAAQKPPSTTLWIVVAAGNELIYYDPHSIQEPRSRVSLPETIGALRSLRVGETFDGQRRLLIGAAQGVFVADVQATAGRSVFSVADAGSVRGGINSAALVGKHLLASHSELGLLCWPTDQLNPGQRLLNTLTRGAKAIRNVLRAGEHVYLSIDDRVVRFSADVLDGSDAMIYRGGGETLTALWSDGSRVIAGDARGRVLHWQADQPEEPELLHAGLGRAAESVDMLESEGVERLFFTDTSSAVHVRVMGDSFTCHYEAGGQTIRRAEAAPDLIVATNELRDRLILWLPSKPAQPLGIISIARTTGRSVQDFCLIPRSSSADANSPGAGEHQTG